MTQKAIIFDSGALISFSMNGIIDLVKRLKGIFKGKFLITKDVKREIIDKPLTIKRFELEALKLKELLDEKVLEMPSSLGIKDSEISKKADELMSMVNNTFIANEKPVHLIEKGESSCLALSKMLNKKGTENVIAVDERTTRSFVEKPDDLKKFLEKKLHTKITPKTQNYKFFNEIRFIRSAELVYVAYKKGLVKLKNKVVLDALLYAVKFKGCAISGDEIREIEKIG